MSRIRFPLALLTLTGLVLAAVPPLCAESPPPATSGPPVAARPPGYVGSSQCRECHEKFYALWSTSHHGLAMQPFTAEFERNELTSRTQEVAIGNYRYRAVVEGDRGWVVENGPGGEKRYPIHHALGGKNVYYFLTPMERGRLQVLPIAFNVRARKWYDTTASMVRHFLERRDHAISWKDRLLTFNVACHGCHVSQLSGNYDFAKDSYRTVWTEPGINCETCHGPGEEHVRVARQTPAGRPLADLKIISTKLMSREQLNGLCAPCHAKMYPLTAAFKPGDHYFDHYGLSALESPDFHPDGRDLGENYTFTSWRMSPCANSGQLSCMHCHTSSGRYRFAPKDQANDACLPCHKDRVEKAVEHTHHKPDSEGNQCVACHMPRTEFALMRRSDHSMLPPTPAATIRFKSPNACNNTACHDDQDAAWSDKYVREWHKEDYQAPVLQRADLIAAARKRDWTRLPDMLAYLRRKDRDEIFAASLIRLLQPCDDRAKWPVLLGALTDSSPLVRAAAATALESEMVPETRKALLEATDDAYRLVRVSAAAALAAVPRDQLPANDQERLKRATAEYETMLQSRPDDWSSHYNRGNYLADRGEPRRALEAYSTAMRLDPTQVPPLVNASMVHARSGDNARAAELLQQALRLDPANAEANFNLGLLMAELGDPAQAEKQLRAALKADPALAAAACNLAVLVARDRPGEAIEWCRKAAALCPSEPKYAYTLAFYLNQTDDLEGAADVLRRLIKRNPDYADAYLLLGGICERQGKAGEAESVYRKALYETALPAPARRQLELKLRTLRRR